MLNKLIKTLGGYTREELKNECEKFKNTFDEIPEDEIKIGDPVYFYYVSRIDYQTSRYHAGVVEAITSIEDSVETRKKYRIRWTFLTYMEYHNIEKRIPRDEKLV